MDSLCEAVTGPARRSPTVVEPTSARIELSVHRSSFLRHPTSIPVS